MNPSRRKQQPAQSGWSSKLFLINGQGKENPEISQVKGAGKFIGRVVQDGKPWQNHYLVLDKQGKKYNLKDNLSL